mmetsp:Transcript_1998/g.4054  ORF Transcript_1998/g.4054 Transcript_1998/m.4054 type:complete len:131 (-) Transcript_1998:70-462(-)
MHGWTQVLRINAANCTASAPVKVVELDWGVADHRNQVARRTTPHLVVASDVVYEEQNIGPFIRTIQALWTESAAVGVPLQALVALKNREQAIEIRKLFFEVLDSKGFQATEVKPASEGVSIYCISQHASS